jgi:hypothetical protein
MKNPIHTWSFGQPWLPQPDPAFAPANGKAYYELHVTPSNSILQLFFDGSGVRENIEHHAVAEPLFTSRTTLTATGWSVESRIPLGKLFPGEAKGRKYYPRGVTSILWLKERRHD